MPYEVTPARRALLARIHCLKKEKGWSDDEYRDILAARTGRRSAADLADTTLARLIHSLGEPVRPRGRPQQAHEWAWVDTAAADRKPLLRKLIMLAKGAGIARGHQVAYIEGIARQMSGLGRGAGPVDKPLPMCDHGELWLIVAALAKHVARQGGDPNAC